MCVRACVRVCVKIVSLLVTRIECSYQTCSNSAHNKGWKLVGYSFKIGALL